MKRSKYSLSNYKLLTGYQGPLIPVGITEVLPGDSIQMSTSVFIRMSPLLSPVMHPVQLRIHHWFVPHRLVWDEWEDFITGGPDGMDASVFPTMSLSTSDRAEAQLADYYGVPRYNGIAQPDLEVSALPFRGYNMIWNEWYRDQDLQTELTNSTASGADVTSNRLIRRVNWEKDYFTTARPWPQKGPDVTIPATSNGNQVTVNVAGTDRGLVGAAIAGNNNMLISGALLGGTTNVEFGAESGLGINIHDLREGLAIQRYEEARARYGSRYTEYLRYLGVKSSDARLQRPEYLGGGRQTIQFSEVLQTAPGTDVFDDTIGAMKGHGIGSMRSNRWRRFFEEHGYIHSFVSVKPRTMYMWGLDRHWNRRSKEDFFQKELQHIGQQEVLNKEVYVGSGASDLDATWGYQDRYDEYRRGNISNCIAGRFGSTLDYWHMARQIAATPALNDSFVIASPTARIYADTTEPDFLMMANNSIQARRMVSPKTSSFAF